MTEHHLSLRPIGENDYSVLRKGRAIGRIGLADERPGHEIWAWNITIPLRVPSGAAGRAPSLDLAKAAFRLAWDRFYASLTAADIEFWQNS
jgi:hypothetical protein